MKHGKALLTLANGQPVPPDLADDNDVLFGILSMALTGDETPPAALQVLHEAHDRGDRDGARLWRDLKERLEPANTGSMLLLMSELRSVRSEGSSARRTEVVRASAKRPLTQRRH